MKIIGNIFYTLFILLLVGVAGLFLASLLPFQNSFDIKIVKSGSMEPAIPTGSIVVVRPSTTYAVGDVVTFGEDNANQIPTTHRIIDIREEGGQTVFSTKGDANEDVDPVSTPQSEVIGKIAFHVPYAGFVLDFARQPIGFTLMIGIPAGVIILDEMIRVVQEVYALRRKKLIPMVRDNEEPLSRKRAQYFDMPPERTKAVVNIRSFDIPHPDQRLTPMSDLRSRTLSNGRLTMSDINPNPYRKQRI